MERPSLRRDNREPEDETERGTMDRPFGRITYYRLPYEEVAQKLLDVNDLFEARFLTEEQKQRLIAIGHTPDIFIEYIGAFVSLTPTGRSGNLTKAIYGQKGIFVSREYPQSPEQIGIEDPKWYHRICAVCDEVLKEYEFEP